MAIGAGWAEGSWVDAGWVVGAWQQDAGEPEVTAPSGGWDKLSQFDDHIKRKREQEQQRQSNLEAINRIESPVDSEIAKILQADVRQAETEKRLKDLEQLVAKSFRNEDLPRVREFNERVAKAFVRANVQGNFSAIQAFEREMERAIEEEEFLLMALLLLE